MKQEEVLQDKNVSLIALLISVVAIAFFFVSLTWSIGWMTGYEQGHKVSKAYYEAVGELPSENWVNDQANWHLGRKHLILDSLEK